jgi:hypothetical protein
MMKKRNYSGSRISKSCLAKPIKPCNMADVIIRYILERGWWLGKNLDTPPRNGMAGQRE